MASAVGRGALVVGAAIGASAMLASPPARADFSALQPWEKVPAERRSGVVIGVQVGFGVSSLAGFPNDPTKIGFQSAYTNTGAQPGGAFALWIGGALSDYLNVAIGFGGSTMLGLPAGETETAAAILFHVEAFPLYGVGGRWRDLGAYVNAGTGPAKLEVSGQAIPLIDGGATAAIGAGVFWEGLRFWHLGNGPYLEGNYMFAQSARRPGLFLGWRTALYTGTFKR